MNRNNVLIGLIIMFWIILSVALITLALADTQFINQCMANNRYVDLSYTDKLNQCKQAYEIFKYKELD